MPRRGSDSDLHRANRFAKVAGECRGRCLHTTCGPHRLCLIDRTFGVRMLFPNRVAVVTGASSGIGWALAKILAREGCKLGLIARRREQLNALAQEISQEGGTAVSASADVGDRGQIHAAVKEIGSRLGAIDLLVA